MAFGFARSLGAKLGGSLMTTSQRLSFFFCSASQAKASALTKECGDEVDARELEALLRGAVSLRGDVDARDDAAGERRALREAAGVREEVEDPDAEARALAPRDELADAAAVLALIEEGARLLAAHDVDDERNAVLGHPHRARARCRSAR